MTIILCDDNELFLQMISDMMKKYVDLYHYDIVCFSSGSKLIEYCKSNAFDIVYMDIEVGKNNGIDMAMMLKDINPKSLIIYMSAFDTYYVPLANAEPFRFIYKGGIPNDVLEKKLTDALEAAVKRIEGKDSWNYIYNKRNYSVLFSKIKCFYSSGRRVYIVAEGEIEQNYYYAKLDDIQAELEKIDSRFIRINRRVIVNMTHTYYKSPKKVEINNQIYIVSAKYRQVFFEKFKYGKLKI